MRPYVHFAIQSVKDRPNHRWVTDAFCRRPWGPRLLDTLEFPLGGCGPKRASVGSPAGFRPEYERWVPSKHTAESLGPSVNLAAAEYDGSLREAKIGRSATIREASVNGPASISGRPRQFQAARANFHKSSPAVARASPQGIFGRATCPRQTACHFAASYSFQNSAAVCDGRQP